MRPGRRCMGCGGWEGIRRPKTARACRCRARPSQPRFTGLAWVLAGHPAPASEQPSAAPAARRYAGRAFETAAQAQEGRGSLMVKGIKAVWRQSAPFVADTLQVGKESSRAQGPTYVHEHQCPWACARSLGYFLSLQIDKRWFTHIYACAPLPHTRMHTRTLGHTHTHIHTLTHGSLHAAKQGVLECLLMRDDVSRAIELVERQVRRCFGRMPGHAPCHAIVL